MSILIEFAIAKLNCLSVEFRDEKCNFANAKTSKRMNAIQMLCYSLCNAQNIEGFVASDVDSVAVQL